MKRGNEIRKNHEAGHTGVKEQKKAGAAALQNLKNHSGKGLTAFFNNSNTISNG